FATNPPARSFVPVASWPMEFDIEIECVAVA
ncbi:RidA family protein, partial [Mesorhizobium sp. M2D.F.Ca.ET.223.01.1.1]